MALIDEVTARRLEIRTDGYAMSIGEWVSLYENKEIDIHPEFQRFFRWSPAQKTNLIESILLGIPVPPIFVSQRPDGIWDVVDGLQRLSTIYQFMGQLKDENGNNVEPLTLTKTKYLPGLEEKKWNNPEDPNKSFSQDLRLIIKRSKISVSIILKESDANAKYDLFQRLNTGGSQLSPQEVRNCIMVMLDRGFFVWLKDLATYANFQECIALSDRPLSESYDIELVLRFVIFSLIEENRLTNIGDVGTFITDQMTEIATQPNFDKKLWSQLFRSTFDLLAAQLNDDSFKRYDKTKTKFLGGFLLSQFEVVAFGIAYALHAKGTVSQNISQIVSDIWTNPEFTNWSGSGITATRRLPHLIPFGRGLF